MEYRGDTGDPYVDRQTGVLRNLAGIADGGDLEKYEGEMSILRQFELEASPIYPARFDVAHLQAIHRYLFQDVYAWAGQLRTVDIAKDSSRFASHLFIESYLSKAFARLAIDRRNWTGPAAVEDRAGRFAHYLGEINATHPFREGNGRTQRIFIGQLAREHGWEIRWDLMTATEMVEASVASFGGDDRPLAQLIQQHLYGRA